MLRGERGLLGAPTQLINICIQSANASINYYCLHKSSRTLPFNQTFMKRITDYVLCQQTEGKFIINSQRAL
jgi:hypothetical protein